MAGNEKSAEKRIVWNRNGLLPGKQVVGIKLQIEGNIEDNGGGKKSGFYQGYLWLFGRTCG